MKHLFSQIPSTDCNLWLADSWTDNEDLSVCDGEGQPAPTHWLSCVLPRVETENTILDIFLLNLIMNEPGDAVDWEYHLNHLWAAIDSSKNNEKSGADTEVSQEINDRLIFKVERVDDPGVAKTLGQNGKDYWC